MTDANNMRRYLKLFEAAAPDYVGPKASDTVSYAAEYTKGKVTKITATLKSYESGRYTKLGRDLLRITELTEELNTLQKETKAEARELVADIFNAEDAACTRVVDTVSFVFQLSKDPEAVGSVSYAKVLKELESHLTPELISVLETLKAKHTSAPVQRAASLKAIDKAAQTEESIVEGLGDKLVGFFKKLYQDIKAWGIGYDSKLDSLKAQVGITEDLEEGWAEERQAFHAEIASKMGEPLSDSLIDAIEAAAVTQDEWNRDPMGCKQRIRGAQEELYDFESVQENQEEDDGWYTHHEMYGKISKEDWKKGWRYNHQKSWPFYNINTKTWHDEISEDQDAEFNVGDMVCATNPKAKPGYEILDKNADSYTLKHRYRDENIILSKERIHRVNKARLAMAEPVTEISQTVSESNDAYQAGRLAYYKVYTTPPKNRSRDIVKNPFTNPRDKSEWRRGFDDMGSMGWTADDVETFKVMAESECEHDWVEGVDDDGNLVEPAYDVCVNCGEVRD